MNTIKCPSCGYETDLEEGAKLSNRTIEEERKNTRYCCMCGYRLAKTRYQEIIEEEITECVKRIMSRLGLQ